MCILRFVALEPLCCMIELVGCLPALHTHLSKDLKWIKDQLSHAREEIRDYAALLYGIILSLSTTETEFEAAIRTLISDTSNKSYETQHGSIIAVGHSLGMIGLNRKIDVKQLDLVRICIETLGKTFF